MDDNGWCEEHQEFDCDCQADARNARMDDVAAYRLMEMARGLVMLGAEYWSQQRKAEAAQLLFCGGGAR